MRQRPSLGAPEVPPDVPPEFADAYLRGYARALAEATTTTTTGEPADAVDVPELPPSLTGFVIPEEGPALPAPRVAPVRRASLPTRGPSVGPTATHSPFPSPRPGSTVRPPVPAEGSAEAPVLGDVVDGQVVAASAVVPEAPRVAPVVVEDVTAEPGPATDVAEHAEPEWSSGPSSSEPFVPWAFEPPAAGDQDAPRRWQFEPPEEHTANVALEILEAEERVPGAGWTFEPPVVELVDLVDEAPTFVDALFGLDSETETVVGPEPAGTPPAREQHDDLVPGMRTYYRTDGAVYADADRTAAAAEVPPWMIPMMTMSLIAALFLAVYVLAR